MTDLRQAAQALLNRWDSPLWKNGSTADAIADLRTALEQQQAEPVGSLSVRYYRGCKSMTNTDFDYTGDLPEGDYELYTAPPQRKELSAGEILNMMPSTIPAEYDGELMEFARAVETKTKEGT